MQDHQAAARRYEKIKLIVSISETILALTILAVFTFSGYSAILRDFVNDVVSNPYLRLLTFLAFIGLGFSVIDIPLSFYTGYYLEHRFQLSNQTFMRWVWEETKGFLVGVILMTPILLIFYFLLLNHPQTWWFWTACVMFVFSIVLGRIAPQVIFPLFYKFEKLDDPALLDRMNALAVKGGFALQGVFRFNMSKNTKKANAALTGLGKSKRIILGDTLLEKFSPDEIETVFAHEVGHFVHKHLWIGVFTGTILSFFTLFIADQIFNWAIRKTSLRGVADLAALPLLSIILGVLAFILEPLSNALSRNHERQADRYALNNGAQPASFINAMQKLSALNLTDQTPHPLVEFLFHSHPSIAKRIRTAENWTAARG